MRGWHIGLDEAGRGCLAGPVVAAAVLAPPDFEFAVYFSGLTDSKALSVRKREILRAQLKNSSLFWGLGMAWPAEIDRVNILNASFRAMSRAARALYMQLARRASAVFSLPLFHEIPLCLDGPLDIPSPQWEQCEKSGRAPRLPRQYAVIRGDVLVPAISAASVLAKTQRDRLMLALGRRYPDYGFAAHKGYATREHMELLEKYGRSPQHRKSFRLSKDRRAADAGRQFSLLPDR